MEIHIHGEIIRLKGLVDSGNQLYDPMTKTPVMIVQADQLMSICGEPFIELMKQSHPVEVMQKLDDQFPLLDRLRLVPYRAVGHDHGFLLMLKTRYGHHLFKDAYDPASQVFCRHESERFISRSGISIHHSSRYVRGKNHPRGVLSFGDVFYLTRST